MRILFLTNNHISQDLIDWIRGSDCGDNDITVFSDSLTVSKLNLISPDIIISYSYCHIITTDVLLASYSDIINLHISYLPFNRGSDPNLWSFLENSPKGVSIHLVDNGIDTGDILFQREVLIDEKTATLTSSYLDLQNALKALFKDNWESIRDRSYIPHRQVGPSSFHLSKDFKKIKESLLGVEGWDIGINLLRHRYEQLKGIDEK
jgi:methionyl-tRNA formyltransferase